MSFFSFLLLISLSVCRTHSQSIFVILSCSKKKYDWFTASIMVKLFHFVPRETTRRVMTPLDKKGLGDLNELYVFKDKPLESNDTAS